MPNLTLATPMLIDLRTLTRVEQEEAVNFLWVNGQRVWDYDRYRSWAEPKEVQCASQS